MFRASKTADSNAVELWKREYEETEDKLKRSRLLLTTK
jgi:hypothetical protein